MHKDEAAVYVDPETRQPLTLQAEIRNGDEVVEGTLTSPSGTVYPITGGLPDLTFPRTLPASDAEARSYYAKVADVYDEYLPLTFSTFKVDEDAVRNHMIDDLRLTPESVVLEHGAGSGRDSALIAARLGTAGRLYVQDLSPDMLRRAVERLQGLPPKVEMAVANGSWLPFPDRMFDAVYHFGGLNTFADIRRAFAEAVRVTKVGGRVVMGDESMPPWLRDTDFGRILMNSNPHYRYPLPLEHMPIEARDVKLEWVLGGVFYVISFTVGEGEPPADFDFPIPGPRGGTHRTRYHGHLEGVTEEAKAKAMEACARSGKSMHDWLIEAINAQAAKDLGRD